MAGSPTISSASIASEYEFTVLERADSRPISSIAFLNKALSSAFAIASGLAPISSTLNWSKTPSLNRLKAVLSAVCPPIVGSKASGRSFSMIRATISGVIGSI